MAYDMISDLTAASGYAAGDLIEMETAAGASVKSTFIAAMLGNDGLDSALEAGNAGKVDGFDSDAIAVSRGSAGAAPDWDTLTKPGYYSCEATQGANSPKGSGAHYGTLEARQPGSLALMQIYRDDTVTGDGFFRTKYSTSAWSAWTRYYDAGNDGNGGQPPAPKPQYTAPYTQVGTFYDNNLADATGWTNPGGTWLIMAIKWATATGAIISITSAITTGNLAAPSAGERYSIWAWRIL